MQAYFHNFILLAQASFSSLTCDTFFFFILGEKLIKKVYEALRAGPKWEETLFLITYDEHGGFYDHVVPPHRGIPGDNEVRLGHSCVAIFSSFYTMYDVVITGVKEFMYPFRFISVRDLIS